MRHVPEDKLTTTTFRTPMVLDFIIDKHPDCIVRIGWETCTSNVTFRELYYQLHRTRRSSEVERNDRVEKGLSSRAK